MSINILRYSLGRYSVMLLNANQIENCIIFLSTLQQVENIYVKYTRWRIFFFSHLEKEVKALVEPIVRMNHEANL